MNKKEIKKEVLEEVKATSMEKELMKMVQEDTIDLTMKKIEEGICKDISSIYKLIDGIQKNIKNSNMILKSGKKRSSEDIINFQQNKIQRLGYIKGKLDGMIPFTLRREIKEEIE